MYNTELSNFNKYHLEKLTDLELVNYAELNIKDSIKLHEATRQENSYNNDYMLSSRNMNVNHIIKELKVRGLIPDDVNYYWGFEGSFFELVVNSTDKTLIEILGLLNK